MKNVPLCIDWLTKYGGIWTLHIRKSSVGSVPDLYNNEYKLIWLNYSLDKIQT